MDEKSEYFSQAQQMRDRLNSISPSMCLAKWLQVSINLTNGLTQSCYHPPTHKVSLEDLEKNPRALHNTKEKLQQRKQMKAGKRPAGCEYCWKIEDAPGNFLSDRHIRSSEDWARNAFDEVVNNPFDYDVNPRYVEVNFNQTCNLKCSYCSPHISSTWAKEVDKLGPYPTVNPHNDLSYFKSQGLMPIVRKGDNPFVKAFWEWWPELYNDIKVFRMTGGEPLLDRNTFRVLDWIKEHPRPDLELAITSNMCPPEENMLRFIESIKEILNQNKLGRFMLFPSIDTWGKQAEYIRTGLDFNLFWKNIRLYMQEVPDGLLTFIITMNNLSLPGLKDLLQGILDLQKEFNSTHHRIFFDTPFLRYPSWQSLQTLPDDYHHYMDEAIEFMKTNTVKKGQHYGFRDTWIERMERTYSWMKQQQDPADLQRNRVDFYRFFSEFDKRRKVSFTETFPEMKTFWNLCKEESNNFSPGQNRS